ncbi:alkylation response protein AidB-like acyl-CoA dehydrogenase [Jatrophihabitans sp. GAS493]|uniref:acyl-CoA dehydrogenase n=1 Tax=Jatrophihabitans sp. GAS493 TaxID=1907575 RepID=UPI000BB8C2A3|nr:acyl-CoA dehydrogenase [Jatrophihabitans sp. GAS493]SOD72110.1 alkylation response protein AidB-like acyl-CoA dehydrogenase [Jatrophihabitans sp. GAS493]
MSHSAPARIQPESGEILGRWQDLMPSQERAELSASASRHFGERFGPDVLRAAFDVAASDGSGWGSVVSHGYAAIGMPEEFGGIGSLVDLVAVLEESGRALLSVPLLATTLAWQTRVAFGSRVDVESGKAEALGVVDVSGTTIAALDGNVADRVVVVRPCGTGAELHQIDPSQSPPHTVYDQTDPGRPLAVFAAGGTVIATSDRSVDQVLAPARVLLAADLIGVAVGALDRSISHALVRQQFARPIGEFQAIKHRLADVYVGIERARSLTRAAAVAIGAAETATEVDDGTVLSLLAKAAAGEVALDATAAFVQVLGAMGLTFEADAHLFFRRAQQSVPFLGSPAVGYARAATLTAAGSKHEY